MTDIAIGRHKDLTGQRFGKLVAIKPIRKLKAGSLVWKCKCDCGSYSGSASYNLLSGKTTACGCVKIAQTKARFTSHGLRGHSAANSWYSMHARCYSKDSVSYSDYGARGIIVEEAWHNLENFVKDMGEKPENCTLERLDNSKNYGPGNCVWATATEQNRNKRNTLMVTYKIKSTNS